MHPNLPAALPKAAASLQIVAPNDVDLRAIGRVGAFRVEAATMLWPLMHSRLVEGAD